MNVSLPAEPRSEPLLWLQLLGVGALPLEALLILLLLAGSDPGPWPWLERGLAWSLGCLAPAMVLWRRPADVWSLLLICTPLRGRRELQRRLTSLQKGLGLQLGLVLGAAALLPLLGWLDRWSVLASSHALLPEAPRLVALLLSAAVLALMLWQWQQLLQSLWLLSRPAAALTTATALTADESGQRRLCLGLPLLLPDPLRFTDAGRPSPKRTARGTAQARESAPETRQRPDAASANSSSDPASAPAEPAEIDGAALDSAQAAPFTQPNPETDPGDPPRPAGAQVERAADDTASAPQPSEHREEA